MKNLLVNNPYNFILFQLLNLGFHEKSQIYILVNYFEDLFKNEVKMF